MSLAAPIDITKIAMLRRRAVSLQEALGLQMAQWGLVAMPTSPESVRLWGEMEQRFFRPLLRVRSPDELTGLVNREATNFGTCLEAFLETLKEKGDTGLPALQRIHPLDPRLEDAMAFASADIRRAAESLERLLPALDRPEAGDADNLLTATSGFGIWLWGFGGISLLARGFACADREAMAGALSMLVQDGARGMFTGIRGMEFARLSEEPGAVVPEWMASEFADYEGEADEAQR